MIRDTHLLLFGTEGEARVPFSTINAEKFFFFLPLLSSCYGDDYDKHQPFTICDEALGAV